MGTQDTRRVMPYWAARSPRKEARPPTEGDAAVERLPTSDDPGEEETLGIWAPGMTAGPEDVFEMGFVKEWKPRVGPC